MKKSLHPVFEVHLFFVKFQSVQVWNVLTMQEQEHANDPNTHITKDGFLKAEMYQ
jgi:hypothetical protein